MTELAVDTAIDCLLLDRQKLGIATKQNADGTVVWISAESHEPRTLRQIPASDIINSNRLTSDSELNKRVLYNDFEFDKLASGNVQQIYFRIAKEKAINLHVLNSAPSISTENTILTIAGQKSEGIKSLQKAAQKVYQQVTIKKYGNDYLLTCTKPYSAGPTAIESDYHAPIAISTPYLSKPYFSKAGVFSKQQLDPGTDVLLQYLQSNASLLENKTILDLGCGSGIISLFAAEKGAKQITATDNSATAIDICRKNFEHFSVQGTVIASYIADSITEKHDLVLCNPPFHLGFQHQHQLTDNFLTATKRCLGRDSKAYWVTNSFINVITRCQAAGLSCDAVYSHNNFTIYQISN